MIKQAVIIRYNDKPVMVLPITTFQSAEDYAKFELECRKNIEQLISSKNEVEEGHKKLVKDCMKRITRLEIELRFQKGEITEEEYNELIGEGE